MKLTPFPRLSPQGEKVLALCHAIYAKGLAASSKELKRLHGMLNKRQD